MPTTTIKATAAFLRMWPPDQGALDSSRESIVAHRVAGAIAVPVKMTPCPSGCWIAATYWRCLPSVPSAEEARREQRVAMPEYLSGHLMRSVYSVGDGIGSDSPVATSHVWSRIALRMMLEPSVDQESPAPAPTQHPCCSPSCLKPEPSGCMSKP